jgi:hypothetical protein
MAQSGLLRGDPGGETLMPSGFGNWMIVAGVVLILAGLASQFGLLAWFGNLPGDIRIRRGGFQLFIPITSMIVVSVLFSILLMVFRRG